MPGTTVRTTVRLTGFLTAATLAAGLGLLGPTLPAQATAAPPTLPGVACAPGRPVVRPTHVAISCGDGSAFVIHVRWTSLTPTRGTAKGIVLINDCVPDCATGHFRAYGSRLTFTGVHRRQGVPVFGRLLVRFTTRHPDNVTRMVATY